MGSHVLIRRLGVFHHKEGQAHHERTLQLQLFAPARKPQRRRPHLHRRPFHAIGEQCDIKSDIEDIRKLPFRQLRSELRHRHAAPRHGKHRHIQQPQLHAFHKHSERHLASRRLAALHLQADGQKQGEHVFPQRQLRLSAPVPCEGAHAHLLQPHFHFAVQHQRHRRLQRPRGCRRLDRLHKPRPQPVHRRTLAEHGAHIPD